MGDAKAVGVFCKKKPAISSQVLAELVEWLRARQCRVLLDEDNANIIGEEPTCKTGHIPAIADLIIVLGGDGTLLNISHITHPFDVPTLAVNLGSLGFLTEITLPELYDTLERVFRGEYSIEPRMLLKPCLWRDGQKVDEDYVLNDVVINKGGLARIVDLEVHVNDQYMTSYRADGLIISTPTGSTAYSLSAGGPIIHPSMQALVLSPICPFTLTNRSILVPDQSVIQVRLTTSNEDVHITLDGQKSMNMTHGDVLEIKKADSTFKLIQAPGKNYYQTLRKKLHWGR